MAAGGFHALPASFAGLGVDRRCHWRTGGVEVDATALWVRAGFARVDLPFSMLRRSELVRSPPVRCAGFQFKIVHLKWYRIRAAQR